MTGINRVRTLMGVPQAVRTLLGLTAVITGLLAMHVWIGGHGRTVGHGLHTTTGAAVTAHQTIASTSAGTHATAAVETRATASNVTTATSEPVPGCAGHCESDSTALGLCVLALIVGTVLAFLFPAVRLLPGAVVLRGPPSILLRPLAIPVPSLIRLCISRT